MIICFPPFGHGSRVRRKAQNVHEPHPKAAQGQNHSMCRETTPLMEIKAKNALLSWSSRKTSPDPDCPHLLCFVQIAFLIHNSHTIKSILWTHTSQWIHGVVPLKELRAGLSMMCCFGVLIILSWRQSRSCRLKRIFYLFLKEFGFGALPKISYYQKQLFMTYSRAGQTSN